MDEFPCLRKGICLLGDAGLFLCAVFLVQGVITTGNGLWAALLFALAYTNELFRMRGKLFTEALLAAVAVWLQFYMAMFLYNLCAESSEGWLRLLAWTAMLHGALLFGWQYLFWRWENQAFRQRSACLIGGGARSARVQSELSARWGMKLRILSASQEYAVWQPVLERVDLIVLGSDVGAEKRDWLQRYCDARHKQLCLLPDCAAIELRSAQFSTLGDIPLLFRPNRAQCLEKRCAKRALDVAVASTALLLTAPLWIVVAALIWLEDGGSVFYRQTRVGREEQLFSIYKFRTMREDAEARTGPVFSTQNDDRTTRIGRFLRATRLDELPQLYNVLKGEMSIVGPRPERPVFVEKFKREIPGYSARHAVKPGITGAAQVAGKYDTAAEDKLIYDLLYVRSAGVAVDLRLMLQTLKVLLCKSAAAGVKPAGEENERHADGNENFIRHNVARSGRSAGSSD